MVGLRDRAILLIEFVAARRSEVVTLDVDDLAKHPTDS